MFLVISLIAPMSSFAAEQTITAAAPAIVDNNHIIFGENATATAADGIDLEASPGGGAVPAGVSADANSKTANITFAGSSVISGDLGEAGDVLTTITSGGDTKTLTLNGDVYATTLNFAGDTIVSLAAGKNITAAITTSADDQGTLQSGGTSDINGDVGGPGAALKRISANGTKLTLNGDVYATTIAFGSDGIVTLADGKDCTGSIESSLSILSTSTGTLELLGTTTVSGTVGFLTRLKLVQGGVAGKIATFSSRVNATNITVSGTGELQLNGDSSYAADDVNFDADGTLTLGANVDFSGKIEGSGGTDGRGTLAFAGNNSVSGRVGTDATHMLKQINAGVNGANDTFAGSVYAQALTLTGTGAVALNADSTITETNFDADGTLTIGDTVDLTGAVTNDVTNNGTITCTGAASFLGDLGSTDAGLALITVGNGLVATDGNIKAATLNFAADNELTIADTHSVTAAITNTGGGKGTLTLEGAHALVGAIGSTGAGLKLITVGNGAVTTDGNIKAAAINFAADNELTIADTHSVTAAITNTGGGEGTLTLEGAHALVGAIGSTGAGLKLITVGNGAVTTDGNIKTATLNFAADNELTIADTHSVTAAITNTGGGEGTLTLEGAHALVGAIGSTGAGLNLITVGNGLVTTDGNIKATTINFAGNNELRIAAGHSVTAAVTNTTTNNGTLTFQGAHAVVGDLGSTGAGLFLITVGNGLVTIDGDILATTTDFNGDTEMQLAADHNITGVVTGAAGMGTLTFLGTSTSGGAIGTAGSALKALNLNGGTFTLGHDVVALNTTANGTATVALSGSRNITGNFELAGTSTLNVGNSTLTLSGAYTQGANTALALGVTGTASGQVVGAGNAVVNAGSAVNVSVSGAFIPDGTTYTVIDGGGGLNVNVPNTITSNSSFVTFAGASLLGDLILTANRTNSFAAIAAAAGNSNASAAAAALESAGNDPNATADMLNILNTLEASQSNEIAASMETLYPSVDNGTIQASYTALNQSITTIERRLSLVRLAKNTVKTGISTGDEAKKGIEVWGEGFGNYLHQYNSGGTDGYKAALWGVTAGADSETIFNNLRAGFNGGYVNGYVNSKNKNNRTVIHSSQATVYGTYDLSPLYFDAAFSFALNKYLGERKIRIVNDWRTANSEYYGQQYSGYVGVGYTLNRGKGLEITPLGSMQYMHLHLNSYKETEAGALNLNIASQDYDLAQTGLGIKLGYPLKWAKYEITPEFRWVWLHDFVGEMQQSLGNTYQGGGAAFDTYGVRPDRNTHDLGTSLSLDTDFGVSLTASYDCQLREDLLGHSGAVTVKYSF